MNPMRLKKTTKFLSFLFLSLNLVIYGYVSFVVNAETLPIQSADGMYDSLKILFQNVLIIFNIVFALSLFAGIIAFIVHLIKFAMSSNNPKERGEAARELLKTVVINMLQGLIGVIFVLIYYISNM